jgi:hypothetical protein
MRLSVSKQSSCFRLANATALGLGTVTVGTCICAWALLLYRFIYKLDQEVESKSIYHYSLEIGITSCRPLTRIAGWNRSHFNNVIDFPKLRVTGQLHLLFIFVNENPTSITELHGGACLYLWPVQKVSFYIRRKFNLHWHTPKCVVTTVGPFILIRM